MKKTAFALLVAMSSLLSACAADPYIGVRVKPHYPVHRLHGTTGHERVTTKHFLFDFDYTNKDGKVSFDGTISCVPENVSNWDNAKIDVYILLIDGWRVVQNAARFSTFRNNAGDLCTPKPFSAEAEWDMGGDVAVIFDYKAKMWE